MLLGSLQPLPNVYECVCKCVSKAVAWRYYLTVKVWVCARWRNYACAQRPGTLSLTELGLSANDDEFSYGDERCLIQIDSNHSKLLIVLKKIKTKTTISRTKTEQLIQFLILKFALNCLIFYYSNMQNANRIMRPWTFHDGFFNVWQP